MGFTPAELPPDEARRLSVLRSSGLLDSPAETDFDAVVRAAAEICGVPIALVSLIDENRQWFKAKVGLTVSETPRELAYCAHAILGGELMEVEDAALDPRFVDNPLRTGEPHVNFYAGVPLELDDGSRLGTLCVIDTVPRKLTEAQRESLEALAAQVVRMIELRRASQTRVPSARADATTRIDLRDSSEYVARSRFSMPAMVIAILLGVGSLAASMRVQESNERAIRARLGHTALRVEQFVEERADAYSEILRGAAALFTASEDVTRAEFGAYVDALALDRTFPGVLGLGFTSRVAQPELEAFLARARADRPDFTLVRPGREGELAVISYIEPLDRNLPARGFDMRSDPRRAAALSKADRTGDVVVTQRVTLLQDPAHGPGFLFMRSVRDETGASIGWVFLVIRAREFIRGIGGVAGDDVVLRLRDDPDAEPLRGPDELPDGEVVVGRIEVADRTFALETVAGPEFATTAERSQPWIVLLLGLSTTALSLGLVVMVRSIEDRSQRLARRMTDEIRHNARELRDVVDGTSDLIVAVDADGVITLTNRSFRTLLGHDDAVGRRAPLRDFVSIEARTAFDAALDEVRRRKSTRALETVFVSREALSIEVEGTLAVDVDDPGVVRAIFRDVSIRKHSERALRSANETLQRIASVDALTGVANRRRFDEKLSEEIGRARRTASPVSLVLLDVDHFKKYNDHHGHPAGDECLRRIGACLRDVARRPGELVARYGGEEFAWVLPSSDHEAGLGAAERLRAAIEAMDLPHGAHPLGHVTASLGVATFDPTSPVTAAELVQAADAALYRAKSAGRNRVD